MKNYYDIVVVGGGPVGSYTARRLAKNGFSVCVLEQKNVIGKGVVCTGIVSKESFEHYELPQESIRSQIRSFVFVSSAGQTLKYTHPDTIAYVVDREIFDHKMAENARAAGVEYCLGSYVKSIEKGSNLYKIASDGRHWLSKAVIIATGVNYQLQRKLGFGSPARFLYGSQIELPVKVADRIIEVHISRRYIPGSFAWVVPVGSGKTRVGMIIEKKGKEFLKRFISQRLKHLGVRDFDQKIEAKPIAYGTIKKSIAGKILVIGEAAGQVKTTTGGGIFMGLLCSDIAVEKLTEGLKRGKSILDYEVTWRTALSGELELGKRVRTLASGLNDHAIERLFTFVKYNRFWVSLLVPKINFDFHSDLFYYCLKGFSFLLKHP